jgi:large subunit ribosomal protein L17
MRKRVKGKKLSRSRTARNALFRSQLRALLEYGEIKTTKAKAKAIQPWVDTLVVKTKKDTLASRRQVLAKLANNRTDADKLYIYAKGTKRNSGFTRIVLLSSRRGDDTPMVKLLWVDELKKETSKKADKKKKVEDKKKKDKKTKI